VLAQKHAVSFPSAPDPNVATFWATIPNGGITTSRDNEWIIKLQVAWENRDAALRLLETIPMELLVTFERLPNE